MFAAIVGQGATASPAQLPLLFSLSTGGWATDPHPYNLEINGVDVIGSVDFGSIEIEMAGPDSNGSLRFELWDPTAAQSISHWDEVRYIEHAASRPILFGGFVTNVTWRAWAGGSGRTIVVTCVGYGILLDKKAVPGWSKGPWDGQQVGEYVISHINRHGGRITGLGTSPYPATDPTTITRSVVNSGLWTWEGPDTYEPDVALEPATLRERIDQIVDNAKWINTLNAAAPITAAYWVDSYARLRFFPVLWPGAFGQSFGWEYDEGMPGLAVDDTGGLVEVEYEEEDADRLSAAYVVGFQPKRIGSGTADTNRILASTTMANGELGWTNTQASWGSGFRVSVTHTSSSTTDDLGTVTVSGTDLYGRQQQETFNPKADGQVRGTAVWDRIYSIALDDWTGTAGADSIKVGTRSGIWAIEGKGTGTWYSTPMDRAGDLIGLVTDENSVIDRIGSAMAAVEIGRTEGATSRGSVTLQSETPLDIWPGRHLTVDYPAVNQDGSTDFRMTSVRIKWQSLTSRTYEISYGKTGSSPSLARRIARLNRRLKRNR